MHIYPLVSPQEVLHEVILVHNVIRVLVIEVSQNVTLLLPEVDDLLELHLAFGINDVLDVQTVYKPLSFELLSYLRLHVGHRHVQLVQIRNLLGVSDVFTVQVDHSFLHVRVGERPTSGLSELCSKSHDQH